MVFYDGKVAKLLIALLIALTLAVGAAIIFANNNLAQLMSLYISETEGVALLSPMLATVGLFVLVYVMGFFVEYIIQSLQWRGEEKLKKENIAKLLNTNYSYFKDKQPTDVWSQLNLSTQQTANFCVSILFATSSFIVLVFYMRVIFAVSNFAGLFIIIAMPIYVILTATMGTRFYNIQIDTMNKHKSMSLASQETFTDVTNIKAKGAYQFFICRILDVQAEITKNMVVFAMLNYYVSKIIELFSIALPLLIIFAVIHFIQEPLNAGAILVLFINAPRALANFGSL